MKNSTKRQTRSLLKRDFDNAVKEPWKSQKCIVAQFMIRNGLKSQLNRFSGAQLFADSHGLSTVMNTFDNAFFNPGDEKRRSLRELRASLPIKVILSEHD